MNEMQEEYATRFFKNCMTAYFKRKSRPRLSPPAFSVWAALVALSARHQGWCNVCYPELMELTGIKSRETVKKCLKEIHGKGMAFVRPSQGMGPRDNTTVDVKELRGCGLTELGTLGKRREWGTAVPAKRRRKRCA